MMTFVYTNIHLIDGGIFCIIIRFVPFKNNNSRSDLFNPYLIMYNVTKVQEAVKILIFV